MMYDYKAEGALPDNEQIKRIFPIAEEKLKQYTNIQVALSGGSDSDIMLDIIEKCRQPHNNIYYVYYNAGLDFDATKRHLKYLEDKYNINIMFMAPKKSIPTTCREIGQPFLSKKISNYIERLQKHGFEWEDSPTEVLLQKYSRCESALKWFSNGWGENSQFNIEKRKWLREYMLANPPTFKISDKCCDFAKKHVAKEFHKTYSVDLECTGIRKAEGGRRATSFTSCFSEEKGDIIATFRPVFFFKKEDKAVYKRFFGLTYSDCYEKYGMNRTGCVGCPFGKDFEEELEIVRKNEPKFYQAIQKIFKDAYEYQRGYYKFRDEMDAKVRQEKMEAAQREMNK